MSTRGRGLTLVCVLLAGLVGLFGTLCLALILVHHGKDDTQQLTFVRVEQPGEEPGR